MEKIKNKKIKIEIKNGKKFSMDRKDFHKYKR